MNNCKECRTKKLKYDANGIDCEYIPANSQQGQELIAKLDIKHGGTVVDLDTMRIIEE
jgi:hypothetical protein